jgi:HK97 family phage major capsid protein
MKTRSKKPAQPEKREHPDLMVRDCAIEVRAAEGDAPAAVSMSVSSEEPVLSYIRFNDQWQRAYEILDHSPGSVNLARAKEGLVILDRHYGDQIGLMALELKDRKLGGPVRFGHSQRAQDVSKDAAAGIRRNVSVGYQVDSASYRLEGDKDGIPVVRAMSWTPYEASFEPVPADPTVGVNRADQNVQAARSAKETKDMDPKEMAKLFARAAKYGIGQDEVAALITDDATADSVRAKLDGMIVTKQDADAEKQRKEIEKLKTAKPEVLPEAQRTESVVIAAPAVVKNDRRYSVTNLCRALSGESVDIGFEREVSQELCKQRGKQAKGFVIPFSVLATRDLSVSGTSSATVATMLDSGNFIELLRTNYILGQLGVQFMPGMVGNYSVPKMSAGATTYHVTEGGDITESEPTMTSVPATPHTIGALVDITRRMMEQSSPAAESMVRNEIVERIMRGMQIAVFAGTGADGQPSAITNASGINNPSVTQGTPTHAEILNFIADIMADNAAGGAMRWAMTAEVWAKLADTDVDSGSGLKVLDYKSKTMVGYPYVDPSNDLPANSLWFGNWASVVVPMWGNGIEVASDTAKLFASGGLTLRAMLDYDVIVRLGQALAYNTAVTS